MNKKPIAFVGTSILLFSTLMPTGVVFAESIGLEQKSEQTESSNKTLESVQSTVDIPEKTEEPLVAATDSSSEDQVAEEQAPEISEEAPTETSEEPEEAVAPAMTLKFKEEKAIEAGQKFDLEVFGNLKEVVMHLPEGLAFDAEDNLKDEKPNEDYSWNNDKRELTIKNVSEEETSAQVVTLTAEKAGQYEVSVTDEETAYESDKLAFDVAEAVKEEETKESSKEKEETTESSEEKTTESSEEAKDTKKAATKAKTPKTTGIDVGIDAATSFRTYTDPVTGMAPEEYAVAVPLSISTAGIENARVEIPYGFTPDPSNPLFKHFTMTDPIFSLVTPAAPTADSIVDHYENDTANQKLIIHLKKTTTTVETLNLRFKFNPDYDAKIPADQVIWENLQATVYDSADKQISQSGKVQVKSSALDGMSAGLVRFNPENENYVDGPISINTVFYNNYNKYSLLDETYDNQVYIEYPTGSSVSDLVKNYFNGATKTSAEDSDIPAGYTRRYREISDSSLHFTVWNYNGDVNKNNHQMASGITPPASLIDGDSFHISAGISYKKINGVAQSKVSSRNYTKQEQKNWEFKLPALTHNTGGPSATIVDLSNTKSVSASTYAFGYTSYNHTWTGKNLGKKDIQNTRYELYQKNTDSKKVNFNGITVFGVSDGIHPLNFYRVEFKIIDASTGIERVVKRGNYQGTTVFDLPSLNSHEYIDKFTVIPMGTDGASEGALSTGNGFSIRYTARNWLDDKWPDGTAIPKDVVSEVEMGGTLYYDNEKNDQPAVGETLEINTGLVRYAPGNVTNTNATFVSANANSRQPGDTVNYEIQGYNITNAVGSVQNPEVTVAIPKVLEMENPTDTKDFYDAVNGKNYSGAVTVSLVSADSTYNYYRFNATGIGYMNRDSVSYKIPVSFKVASGTPVGKYQIPAVAVSGKDFLQLTQETNNLSDTLAQSMGFDNTVSNSYTGREDGHTTLDIVYASKLNGDSAGRGSSSESWTETNHFAVDKKGTPQMKASINNIGNTSFNNVRLYNILPSNNDGRGSSGNISFTGLENVDGTVYYTTKAISSLPDYSVDLQTWNASTLATHGFSTTVPSNMDEVTAIYIDFGSKVVAPNENLDTVLNFLVPDADNQKAVNQFRYSAKEVGLGTVLNANSSEITFSTEVAKVSYDENLPSFLASGVSNASNMPDGQTVLLDVSGKGTITLSDKEPTLTGYEFVKWQAGSKDYQPGDKVDFTSASTSLTLKAVWKAVSVNVTYDKNDGTTDAGQVKKYDFGDTVDLSAVTNPTRTGYQFKGWGTTATATTPDFADATKVDFVTNKTVYAIWEANAYTVKFNSNGGTGTMTDQAFKYDTAGALKENTFTRAGYKFLGWAKAATAITAEYGDKNPVNNLSSAVNGVVQLHAVWEAQDQKILFDVNGGDTGSGPADITRKTDESVNIDSQKVPTRTGYKFDGWMNGSTKITGTIKMPAGGMTLKAAWKANTYKVAFHANKGTGTMASQSFAYDENKALSANTFTRSGYNFIGWATSASGNLAFVDKAPVDNLTTKDGDTVNLYAVWSATEQVLTFDVNGGDPASAPDPIESETDATVDISKVKAPTRTGYKFTGWYDGAIKVGDSVTMPVGGKVLKAEWEAITYTVKFDGNKGVGSMASQAFVYDVNQNLTKNSYTRAGYRFDGWALKANSTSIDYSNEISVGNLTTTDKDEVTLYAVWTALNQDVTFDLNGGTGAIAPISRPTDSMVDITTVQAPTKTGYKFAGWYDGATKAATTFTMPAGGKKLRAEWTPIKYSVTFDKNTGSGSMAAQEFDYDMNQGLSTNAFTKPGYSFQGWSTSKTGTVNYSDEEPVMNLTDVDGAKIELYAIWKADNQTIRFDVNGGDAATKPDDIIQPTDSIVDLSKVKDPTRTGYQFTGWYDNADKLGATLEMPAGGKTLVAKWKANKYEVEFDGNTGKGSMTKQDFVYDAAQALSKNKFTKAGYSFQGWSTAKDGAVEYNDEKSVSNLTATDGGKVTLYAIWKADDQTVKFDVNGGDDKTKPADIVQPTDSTVDLTKVAAPSRTGYTFAGWYDGSDKAGDNLVMPAGGKTLVAKWTAIKYDVVFDGNTGTGTMAEQNFEYDAEQKLSKNAFEKAGYSFTGWSTAKDGEVEYTDEKSVNNLTATDGEKVTLYAIWKADDQTVKFDVNGGDDKTKPADIVQPTDTTVDLTKVAAPSRTGYTFAGWYDGSDKSEDTFVMPAGGKTLVAKWTANKYDVVFDGNTGTGTMAEQNFEYDAEQKLSKNAFEKAGYSFTGWATAKDGEVEYTDEKSVNNLTATDGEKITLYAIWKADDQTVKFDVNGGDESTKPADIIAKTGEKVDITDVKAPTRSGYKFDGWYVKDQKSENTFEMPVGGLTLVAKWTKVDAAGGDKEPGSAIPTSKGSYRSYIGGRYYRGTSAEGSASAKNLPKTGSEASNPLTALLGMCLLAGSSFLVWIRRSKKDEEK